MSRLMYAAGSVVLLVGLATIGFGMPASALDFGNTLLVVGTTASIGGLLLIGLGAVVAQLQRIAENLAFESERQAQPAFAPAPPEPLPRAHRVESEPFEPRGPAVPPEFPMPPPSDAPKLPNPEESAAAAEQGAGRELDVEPLPDTHQAAVPTPTPEPPKRGSFFDSVWPLRERHSAPPPAEPEPLATETTESTTPEHTAPFTPEPSAPESTESAASQRAVAILKSGVVDGMGYTLYVDGSIEAELPEGTVRFASIHELRAHLEKGG